MSRSLRHDVVYHVLRMVLGLGSLLPLVVSRPICRWLARIALRLSGRDRRRIETHLEIAFPELGPKERRRLMRRCADHLGRVLGEVAWLWGAKPSDVEQLVEVEGFEHLKRALDEGNGAILFTGHLGNWELLNARLAVTGIPISVAVRELDDPRIDELITKMRSRFGSEVVHRGATAGRDLVRAITDGRGIGLLIDQDIPSIPGVFVPFFGREAWTPSGAAMLSLRTRCPLLPGFIHRRPDGTHKIRIEPPLKPPEEGSLRERVRDWTAEATSRVEWHVRAWPEQWVWMHRRWRTRPEDEVDSDS